VNRTPGRLDPLILLEPKRMGVVFTRKEACPPLGEVVECRSFWCKEELLKGLLLLGLKALVVDPGPKAQVLDLEEALAYLESHKRGPSCL